MDYNAPFDVSLAEYEGLITRREYWDDLAEEWNWSSTEQKLVCLAGFVQQGGKIGSDGNIHEDWELLSDSKWMSDEILDKIEYRHWHENPDEAFSTYSNRAQVWWDNRRSLW